MKINQFTKNNEILKSQENVSNNKTDQDTIELGQLKRKEFENQKGSENKLKEEEKIDPETEEKKFKPKKKITKKKVK